MLDLHIIFFLMKIHADITKHNFGKCITDFTIYPPQMLIFNNKIKGIS